MNKVVTISLNGRAYQLEERGYGALRAYLDGARLKLAGNPDADEIMRDLETAIAEKLSVRLGANRNVASGADVDAVLDEMGPVDASGEEANATAAGAAPKKLYRLAEDEMIFGICAGLAAYFAIDVTLVRVLFVVAAILTGGGFALAYFVMMLLIPTAKTPAEHSAASGAAPVTAQELIDRVKREYEKWDKGQWKARKAEMKRRWREQKNTWQHENYGRYTYIRRSPTLFEELLQLALCALFIWAIYTYIPATQPFFHHLGMLLQQAWAWLNAKIAR